MNVARVETWEIDFTEIEIEVKQLDVKRTSRRADYHFKYNMATGKGG